jgi:hypothetical protein
MLVSLLVDLLQARALLLALHTSSLGRSTAHSSSLVSLAKPVVILHQAMAAISENQ